MLREPAGKQFEIKPEGNWFDSEYGIPVLRLTAWDAEKDGVQMYDVISGKNIPVEEHRRLFRNEDVWERNYGVRDITSGTGAIGLLEVESAQRRGQDTCFYIHIKNDDHLKLAKERLHALLGSGEVGCGWDLATTTEQTSNPSAFTVIEKTDKALITRLICTWKTDSDEVQETRARQLLEVVAKRPAGGRTRRLCIDSTNERLFARRMTDEQSREREDFSFSPPNAERVGVRGQFERSKTEEVFSTELLNRLAREFNTTVSSARSRDGSMPASPVTSLERMGFVFNSGSSRADDHARSTAENTRKTVLLLERIEKKNPSGAGENTFSHIA
jgi:hypothetical protein